MADASIASITSSSERASAWMSSRSSGVTNVRLQALDDLVGQEVALVLDFLDLVGLVPDRPVGREHLLEQRGAVPDLLRQRDEIVVEPLFLRNQSERHIIPRRGILADSTHTPA